MSPRIPVLLSTSSVFPEPTSAAFEMAAALGYDGIEVMVWTDPVSQDLGALQGLSRHYGLPVGAVHAPCLLVTQRVWSPDPTVRLRRAAELAAGLGASIVVVHPPFSWQREYARGFGAVLGQFQQEQSGIAFAVENMYAVRLGGREFVPYVPDWDPTKGDFDAYTLDLSHCAAARTDAKAMAAAMGDRLAHVHLGDGTGVGRDEHLVPGRGKQPCAWLLASLVTRGWAGSVTLEVSTRRSRSRAERQADLAASLAFARRHLTVSTVESEAASTSATP
jgi:sugar phosphate isomerase/epimerase